MNLKTSVFAALFLLQCVTLLAAQPIGTSAIAPFDLAHIEFHNIDPSGASSVIVPAVDQSFQQALHVQVTKIPTNPWDIQIIVPNNTTVNNNDTLLLSFYARVIKPNDGSALINAGFEEAGGKYDKSLDFSFSPAADWKRIDLPFKSIKTYAPGGAHLHIVLGYSLSTVEIGGIELTDYGQGVDPMSLPHYILTYKGRELNAPWRAEADVRIEKYRKGDILIQVVDANGRKVKGADVSVKMLKHSFGFGTAVSSYHLDGTSADDQKYTQILASTFNKFIPENEVKWGYWYDGDPGRNISVKMLDWAIYHGMTTRGQCLLWPSWEFSPDKLQPNYESVLKTQGSEAAKQFLANKINEHIVEELTLLKGKVTQWDVVNEPIAQHDYMDILGPDAMAGWYKLAHQTDPDAKLYINNDGALYGQARATDVTGYEQYISSLLKAGAPLQGIGIESHFGSGLPSMNEIERTLNEYDHYKLALEITEYDFKTSDTELQADFTRDFMTECFSHKSMDAFNMWGFWDGSHWLNNAILYNKDWTLKPSGKVYMDLVFHQWWTNSNGVTDKHGFYKVRGFLGDYEITCSKDGKSQTVKKTISLGKNKILIQL